MNLVVFDLAGTTIKDNQDVHRVLQNTLSKFGVSISLADANEVMGISKPVAIRMLLNKCYRDASLVTAGQIDEMHKQFIEEMIAFYEHDAEVGEKDDVSNTFAMLKEKNIKVFVDTGFDRLITDVILKRVAWKHHKLIDGSVTSDEVKRGRPYPDLIFKAMQLAGVDHPMKVAKVGDTSSDMEEGTSAGCQYVIGVTTGAFSREALMEYPHTHLVEHIAEVVNITA